MIQAQNNNLNSDKNLKILNFYSENCPPCHAFMPNFIEASKIFGKYYDFVAINSDSNIELFQKYRVMGTPTVIIIDGEKIIFNQSGVPNGQELKQILLKTAGISQDDLDEDKKQEKSKKTKWFFGLF